MPKSSAKTPIPPVPSDLADDAEEVVEIIEPEVTYAAVAIDDEPRDLIPAPTQQQHHLIVGLGTLAAMPDAEYRAKLELLQRGQDRLEELQKTLMRSGEDYGTVPGVPKPFLHKPGAEKLANFYGLAIRFEAERITGQRKAVKLEGYEGDGGEWETPPLAYHVRAFAHLGNFDGPIIAQGYGESNVWEERYRWRRATPTCPECGRPDLVRRKTPPNLAGKWQCPNWGGKDGCNRVFEPNDPRISSEAKVENEDPWSLANTLIKMAEKRAQVDVVLRATGTSGRFSQDEDSPSVKAQSEEAGPTGDPAPEAKVVEGTQVARGGKTAEVTDAQIAQLAATSRAKDIGPAKIADVIDRLFKVQIDFGEATDRAAMSQVVLAAIKGLGADKAGRLAYALETGSLDEEVPAEDLEAKHGSMADHAAH